MGFYKFLTAAVIAGVAVSAEAAQLDFTGFSSGLQGTTTLVLPEATVTGEDDTTDLFVGGPFGNGLCAIVGGVCEGDLQIAFNFDVQNVNFNYGTGNPGDFVEVSGFDADGNLIGSVFLDSTSGTAFADLSSLGVLRTLYFDDSSTGAGYGFTGISFDRAAAVPLPATLPLMAGGLAALAALRRRRAA